MGSEAQLPRWKPASEKPEQDSECLVFDSGGVVSHATWRNGAWVNHLTDILYWVALPVVPAVEVGDE